VAERRRLDTFALTAGLLCLAVSGLALASRADVLEVDGLVVLATLWLVVGAVGLSRAAQRLLHHRAQEDQLGPG
jgi:hypothetical protein